jgi:hypothetical protein
MKIEGNIFGLLLFAFLTCFVGQGCETQHSEVQAQINALENTGQVTFGNAGIFGCESGQQMPSKDSPVGYTSQLNNIRFLEQTTNVPAKLGTTFGFSYYVPSSFTNAVRKTVWTFPSMKNPNTGKEYSQIEHNSHFDSKPGVYSMLYKFEENFEIVSGQWNFELFANDKLVVEKTFTVTNIGI